MLKMLDYVKMANKRLSENLDRASELVSPLVDAYRASGCKAVRIVASGSSKNSADCARNYMQEALGAQVVVVTPEAFVDFEYAQPAQAFNIAISQSGYSTNTLAALDFMREHAMACVALTANVEAPIKDHVDTVVDYGVGVESVDFVTMGVQTLVEYLVLFAAHAAHAEGRIDDAALEDRLSDIACAVEAHKTMLDTAAAFVAEHRLALAQRAPVMIVGNGSNFGVAEEAALKFNETLKVPAMHHEGEEFVHGPEMQVVPGYRIFIIDDPAGSDRLAAISAALGQVTESSYFLTSHPHGKTGEIAVPMVSPLLSAIPNLVLFQFIAASLTEELGCWDVHPFLDVVDDQMQVKAAGYKQSVKDLEARAAKVYEDAAS